MENLLLVRIDDRLIHGQVMTAWMKTLPAKQIIVVDNKVAKDDFMLFVLQNAAPSGIKVIALTEDEALQKLQGGLDVPSFVLAKSPLSLKKLVENGIDIKAVNIGGMGMKAGRTTVYKMYPLRMRNANVSRIFWIVVSMWQFRSFQVKSVLN